MFHLNKAFYQEEMPARAKRLFAKTFKRYHKLDGGDEDVALHMAKQAVDREYVKLNDRWIPKSAAEEIVRHDLDEDSLSEPEEQQQQQQQQRGIQTPSLSPFDRRTNGFGDSGGWVHDEMSDTDQHSEESDDDDDDGGYYDDHNVGYTRRSVQQQYRVKHNKKSLSRGGGGVGKPGGRRSVITRNNNKLAFK
ncbi:ac58/59-like protein [Alphabaculovirus altersperidaniae]|uniref:Ac58/59-like protein n=1 Tax=Spodoptera eridania nucleopolyhedrovirus TaxID=2315721 RepID=A0ABX6TS45_9ABAC|nr:ac58/59-like protein [Spodoptera eridania nucleopolyhedrovirus]QNV47827.1 ac58/59-like protein [Spodoptera eridania nucleopolyhedrovirus]